MIRFVLIGVGAIGILSALVAGTVTGEMTGERPGIRGKRAARQPERQSKNARKQRVKVIGNAGRTSETPRTMHATLPGTSNATNHEISF